MKPALPLVLTALTLAACANTPMGPQAPPMFEGSAASAGEFRPADFAWSTAGGGSSISGTLAYRDGPVHYSCEGGDVVLAPETPWSRRRMIILYGSATAAAVPVSIVRARTPSAPSGDYARFARHATCGGANHFVFDNLPSGAWFVITLAKAENGRGEGIAVTRRVETHGGPRSVTLN